jgi:2-methylcitrate dehydratase PrpD
MTAATMVTAGFTGVEDVFAGERNYLDAFAANARPEELARNLGVKYEILGTNIKKWSVGSPSQAAIDALLHLMQHENVTARAIEAITVHLPTGSDRTVDHAPSPDVNVQHLLAMLLIDGTLTFQSTHDYPRMRDRAVLALVKKIKVLPSDELLRARPRRQAIVDVKLSDGRQVTHRIVRVRGTADNPMSRDEVEAKARDLLVGVIGPRRTATLIETVRDLAAVKDMAKLRGLWQAPTPGGKK